MITFNKELKMFNLQGAGFSYVFFVNRFGYLQHLHYGGIVGNDDLTYASPNVFRSFSPIINNATQGESLDVLLL